MTRIIALLLAGVCGACATGDRATRGEHATPATLTNANNPSDPNLAGTKMPHTTSRDSEARGNPGGTGGAGVM